MTDRRRILAPRGRRWLLQYTLCMAALQGLWLLGMLLSHKTLLCHSDAYYQQYTTLCYTARAVRGLLSGEGFRMVDFRLGQGLDVMASLGFYGLTNPLYWLGALFSGRGLEVYYHFLVFLYRWLEGLVFALYLRRTRLAGDRDWTLVAGGLMFAFCGYNTAGILKCPYFAAGGICLCLMLLAIERALREGKWGLLSLTTLLTLMVNFYHGYQTLVMAAVYALARLLYRLPDKGTKRVLREGLILLGSAVCGLLLSGFMLVPTLVAFADSARSGAAAGYRASLWVYPAGYYRQLLADFFAPYAQAEYWTQLNFLPWTAAGLFALLLAKGKERREQWLLGGLALAVLGACVPLVGKLFNGMSYVTNRWSYGLAFVCCAGGAAGLRRLADEGYDRRGAVGVVLAAWAAMMAALALTGTRDAYMNQKVLGLSLSAWSVLCGAGLLICAGAWALVHRRKAPDSRRAARFICATTALCCAVYSGGFGALMLIGDEFYDQNLDAQIMAEPGALAAGTASGAFARVDAGTTNGAFAPIMDYNGTGYYWSIIPATVSDYYIHLQAPALRWVFQLQGLSGDPYLSAAAAVGSATRNPKAPAILPAGFVPTDAEGVYENTHALPLGIFFTETLSEETYRTLSPMQKREALLSAAILPGGADAITPGEVGESVPVTPVEGEGAALDAKGLRGRAGDIATLTYDAPEGSLTWLWLKNPRLNAVDNDSYLQVDTRTGDDARGLFYISRPEGNYYYPQAGVFAYLGEAGAGEETLALRLRHDADLSFEGLEVIAVPAERYYQKVEALAGAGTWTGEVGNNAVRGRCVAPASGVLQLSVPYSKGWRATVDGEPRALMRCGGMYMGLALEPGAHEIELRYVTPGLIPGAVATALGALLLVVSLTIRRKLL